MSNSLLLLSFLLVWATGLGCAGSKKLSRSEQLLFLEAVKRGDLRVCQDYQKQGADIDVVDKTKTPALSLAIMNGQHNVVDWLLFRRADPNKRDFFGVTPLMFACAFRDLRSVKKLLETGAKVNLVSETGDSALTFIADCGKNVAGHAFVSAEIRAERELICVEIGRLLLDRGGRLDARGVEGTPLEIALMYGHTNLIRMFSSSAKVKY